MENVLYEYHFNFWSFIPNFIPLIIGIAFLYVAVRSCRKKTKFWSADSFFRKIGFVVGPVAIGLSIVLAFAMIAEHIELKEKLAADDVCVIEGYVQNYHSMPVTGHDTEHFEIDGVYFEYSDYVLTNGYNHAASLGGVVTGNGQHLKIKYVVKESGGITENVILYIAETVSSE